MRDYLLIALVLLLLALSTTFAALWLTKSTDSAAVPARSARGKAPPPPPVVVVAEPAVATAGRLAGSPGVGGAPDPLLPFLASPPATAPPAACKPHVAALIRERGGMSVEIGPGINSVIPQGESNRFIDMYTNEDPDNPHTNAGDDLVHIDYVWSPGQSYAEIVPEGERFHNAVSSHCVEHVPCLVKYLRNVREILRDDGKFYVIVPHREYMFDHYRSRSTLGDAVASYKTGRHLPRASSSVDALLMRAVNDPSLYWGGESPPPRVVRETPEDMMALVDERLATVERGEYVDDHHWVYDEYSFSFIVQQLARLGLVDFEVEASHHPIRPHNEFLVVLRAPPIQEGT
jgi:hypothetical protein